MMGYCVSDARQATNSPQESRILNPLEFQIERFMVHVCLYLACGDFDQGVKRVLNGIMTEKPTDVKKFFWEHIQNDLNIIKGLINVTEDDVIILLHAMCALFPTSDESNFFLN